MKHIRTILSATFLLAVVSNQGHAQQATTSSGGDASGSGGSVAYSVGQIVYTTNSSANGSLIQGVQQPFEISITTGLTETGIHLSINAYPNPTIDYLTLIVDASTVLVNQSMSYQLYDISGKLLESNTIASSSTSIEMKQLATATYFLKVFDKHKEVKTFKIIKTK